MELHRDIPLQKMGRYPQALDARIIEAAKSQGGVFHVSPRDRDYLIQNACKRLKKCGVFKQIKYGVFESYQLLSKE